MKEVSHLEQATANPRLYRPQRYFQMFSDLRVRQAAEECQFQGLALVSANLFESRAYEFATLTQGWLVSGLFIADSSQVSLADNFFPESFTALANPEFVDSLVTNDHDCPGERAAAGRIKRRSFSPDISKPFLEHFLGLSGVVHDTEGHTVQGRCKTFVQSPESTFIIRSDPLQKFCVELALRLVHRHDDRMGSQSRSIANQLSKFDSVAPEIFDTDKVRCIYTPGCRYFKARKSPPTTIKATPIPSRGLNRSPKKRNESAIATTTLSLSIGATLDTSPSWRARK